MLRQFVQWGASPEKIVGIELRREPVQLALKLSPNLDIRSGSADQLPWREDFFDLVCQHTVFTSILDFTLKQKIASEINRVLRPGGAVLWYDFTYDNPQNPNVRGIKAGEIRSLFPGYTMYLGRITLAPPIARRIPESLLPVFYPLLSAIPLIRTHYLGLLTSPKSTD
jgi:SAM-dependent methyltransferase